MLLDSSMTSKPLKQLIKGVRGKSGEEDIEMQSENAYQSDFGNLTRLTKEAKDVYKAL